MSTYGRGGVESMLTYGRGGVESMSCVDQTIDCFCQQYPIENPNNCRLNCQL
jgi:hypothetical protein